MPQSKSKRSNEESPERRSKRKRGNEEEDEEDREKEPRQAARRRPAMVGLVQLFRKDLISAMKLADSEQLNAEDYLLIADTWRQEWERGVQVPVNATAILPVVKQEVTDKPKSTGDFKMPKKFLHALKDETYQLGQHELTGMSQLSEQVVRYDLDDLDVAWLQLLNEQRVECGDAEILEWTMERVIEALEAQCHENMDTKKKTEEGLGIEYDEDIVCEICQSPESEDTNEMVFCDGCDICVHQACYGIQTVPEGSWLCRTCALGIKPTCILCPKVGGAMKSTRSGTKWAHVSCAIWIPEVTIGCVEKMEPITKISMIPASRWSLVCCVCKERCGACIQCSVKACKTAFHVTCAIDDKLEMKTVLVQEKNTEDAYCPKHSKKRDRHGSESEPDSPRKSVNGSPLKECHMTEEEKATLRAERLERLEDEFYMLVSFPEVARLLDLSEEAVNLIYTQFNRALLTPKTEEADLLEKQQEDSLVARMKMFVHLRQDLERVRNLSYMISRREKMKRQFNAARESVFYAALEVLTDKTLNLPTREVEKIVRTYKDIPPPYAPLSSTVKAASSSARRPSQALRASVDVEESMDIKQDSETESVSMVTVKPRSARVKQRRRKSVDSQSKSDDLNSANVKTEKVERSEGSECDGVAIDMDDTLVNDPLSNEAENVTSVQSSGEIRKEVRKSVGRPRKQPKPGEVTNTESDKKAATTDSDIKTVTKKTRNKSGLPDSVDQESLDKPEKVELVNVKDEEDVESKTTSLKRERRASAVQLTEKEKEDLAERFPSSKNVSDRVKAELTGYLKNNKLVVNNRLRQKVQSALLNGKRRNRLGNGIIVDHSQSKLDSFFVKSPPSCDPDSYKSPGKNVSRVLNELSPTRDILEANNIERTNLLRGGMKSTECQTPQNGNTSNRQSPALSEKSFDGLSLGSSSARSRQRVDSVGAASVKDGDSRRLTKSRESTPDSVASSNE
ncbi:JADE1-like protein [Mya arenaria]|uniref:JADE1-like protein n=1 Tax=Mya arenaria TaxID=6604 RepID=A0ABY7DMB5_MYAAR|nr:JADE1-like protein [Mya arenaria]